MGDMTAEGVEAVIFDFDGTLTVPVLDFDVIREEIGLEPGPILEALEHKDDAFRQHAFSIIENHERRAAEEAELQDSALRVLDAITASGIPTAILTRNARAHVSSVMEKFGVEVAELRAREDCAIKPAPDGILSICESLSVDPGRTWMIGDYKYDIQAGNRAGSTTALLTTEEPLPDYAAEADHVIPDLPSLLPLLRLGA
ncbi:MAG: HAD family hydrolase [Phycisphaerae bacterium]